MTRQSATYPQIQDWVREQHGFMPQISWIAHCKKLTGLPLRNNYRGSRLHPCPPEKRPAIEAAFRHFGMLR